VAKASPARHLLPAACFLAALLALRPLFHEASGPDLALVLALVPALVLANRAMRLYRLVPRS
jgi:hypothetical protein